MVGDDVVDPPFCKKGVFMEKVDYKAYLIMQIAKLEALSGNQSESRHRRRMANWMLKAYKDSLDKYEECVWK